MPRRSTTADRILDTGRRLFNEKGYTSTTLTEIADEVGIRQGNLTYHFPTKHDLVLRLREQVMDQIITRNNTRQPGDIVDDYFERLFFIIGINAHYRCLLRDRMQFDDAPAEPGPTPEMVADFEELKGLLGRVHDAGLMRTDIEIDIDRLTRTLWMIGRHWPDHLREMEGRVEMTDDDLVEGIEHHLTTLRPYLTAAGRRRFTDALSRERKHRR